MRTECIDATTAKLEKHDRDLMIMQLFRCL